LYVSTNGADRTALSISKLSHLLDKYFPNQATKHSCSQVLPLIAEVFLRVKEPEKLYGSLLCFTLFFLLLLVPKAETKSTNTETKEGWFSCSSADHIESNN